MSRTAPMNDDWDSWGGASANHRFLDEGSRRLRMPLFHFNTLTRSASAMGYSVFQFPVFSSKDIEPLRRTLSANNRIFAEGFIRGLDALWPRSVATLVGTRHAELSQSLARAVDARNKIFHGQVTELGLDRKTLLSLVADLREWCALLAKAAECAYGYDGFGRDSYRKSPNADLHKHFAIQIGSVEEYAGFLDANVARPRTPKKP